MSRDVESPVNGSATTTEDEIKKADGDKPKFQSPASQWSNTKKWSTTITASIVTFLVGINSTAILSATEEVSEHFNVNTSTFDNSFFLVTAWNAGAAIVPLIILPAMEDFGVRPIYLGLYLLFTIFVMVQAVAQNFATLIVARVIAGSCGGTLQNAIDGMVADIWGDSRIKSFCLSVFILALLGGVTIGPVMGGLIIRSVSWRWISYIQLIIYGVFLPAVFFFIHETRSSDGRRDAAALKRMLKAAVDETVLRSTKMFFTEFVVSSFTLWSAFSFGTVFILTQSIPLVYTTRYNWSEADTGIVQIAIFVGEFIGFLLCMIQDLVIYPRYANRGASKLNAKQTAAQEDLTSSLPSNPEARLYTSIPASFFGLTAGFFIYGWTSRPGSDYAWPLPTLGLLLIGVGIMVIVQAVSTYITDCYPTNANSAVSCIAFGENMFAAFLPLATRDMYQSLGFAWASSLLGFLAIAVSVGPLLLVIFGPRIRAKSSMIG